MKKRDEFFRLLERARSLRAHAERRIRGRIDLHERLGMLRAAARRKIIAEWHLFEGAYVPLVDGTLFFVPPQLDLHGYTVLTRGGVDGYHGQILSRYCAEGTVAIDVGANIGEFTVPFAASVGSTGLCIAVEPISFLADAIRRTASINAFDWVRVWECGASDRGGRAAFRQEYSAGRLQDAGNSRIVTASDSGTVEIELKALDEIVHASDIGERRISLLKIDVEGHELKVLQGAAKLLGEHRPTVVLELGHESDSDRRQIAEIMKRAGYSPLGAIFRHAVLPLDWQALLGRAYPLDEKGVFDVIFRAQ